MTTTNYTANPIITVALIGMKNKTEANLCLTYVHLRYTVCKAFICLRVDNYLFRIKAEVCKDFTILEKAPISTFTSKTLC